MLNREHPRDIETAATVWAAKAERGLTAEERAKLDEWLEGDSRRLGAFVRVQAAWIHAERAAALGTMPDAEATELSGEINSIDVAETAQPRSRLLDRRMVLGGGGAIAASIAAAALIGFHRYYSLESSVGEIRHIALKGGTTLTLDTDTRVDVALSSNDRTLELKRGKLFLDVARFEGRPLALTVGDLLMATVEGAFNIQSLIQAPIIALVMKGQLSVTQAGGVFRQKRALNIGQNYAMMLAPDGELVAGDVQPIANAQREQLLAWRDGMLSFGGEALSKAVRGFDRYGTTRIIVDPQLAGERITGLFKANDPVGFAAAIAASFGGLVSSQGNVLRIYAKKIPTA